MITLKDYITEVLVGKGKGGGSKFPEKDMPRPNLTMDIPGLPFGKEHLARNPGSRELSANLGKFALGYQGFTRGDKRFTPQEHEYVEQHYTDPHANKLEQIGKNKFHGMIFNKYHKSMSGENLTSTMRRYGYHPEEIEHQINRAKGLVSSPSAGPHPAGTTVHPTSGQAKLTRLPSGLIASTHGKKPGQPGPTSFDPAKTSRNDLVNHLMQNGHSAKSADAHVTNLLNPHPWLRKAARVGKGLAYGLGGAAAITGVGSAYVLGKALGALRQGNR